MDKNLKKLSRVELLELLVSLSEDYEDVCAENDRLRRMLADQRLPRSAKVGSIAQAALQANGYFDSVQRSADEYLREIQRLRNELAMRSRGGGGQYAQDARAEAQAIIRDAQAQAQRILAQAQAQARGRIPSQSQQPVRRDAPYGGMPGGAPRGSRPYAQGRSLDMPESRFKARKKRDR